MKQIPSVRTINKFPPEWGELIFPISMSRIDNAQSAVEIFKYLQEFTAKVQTPTIGIDIIYTEGLYMNFEPSALLAKNKFVQAITNHKNGITKGLDKNLMTFQIRDAFCFKSWFQMMIGHTDFVNAYNSVKKVYNTDEKFQYYVKKDAEVYQRELTDAQVQFYLEEHTFAYLILNKQLETNNIFTAGRDTWRMLCYPGKPAYGQVYLCQLDPLKINTKFDNPLKGHYDLTTGLFYDYINIDLNSLKL